MAESSRDVQKIDVQKSYMSELVRNNRLRFRKWRAAISISAFGIAISCEAESTSGRDSEGDGHDG